MIGDNTIVQEPAPAMVPASTQGLSRWEKAKLTFNNYADQCQIKFPDAISIGKLSKAFSAMGMPGTAGCGNCVKGELYYTHLVTPALDQPGADKVNSILERLRERWPHLSSEYKQKDGMLICIYRHSEKAAGPGASMPEEMEFSLPNLCGLIRAESFLKADIFDENETGFLLEMERPTGFTLSEGKKEGERIQELIHSYWPEILVGTDSKKSMTHLIVTNIEE